MAETVTLQIPELLYQWLINTARATNRPLEEIMLYALKVGSLPLKTQTLLHSPYFNRLILTAANQSLPIPTESKTTHRVFMSCQCVK